MGVFIVSATLSLPLPQRTSTFRVVNPRRALTAIFGAVAMSALATAGPCQFNLTISQLYGSGGTAGAVYVNDFVELHNPGPNPVSLNGYAIQHTTASGTTWSSANLPNVSIAGGGYFLVQAGSSGVVGATLPAVDATIALNFSDAAGKIALTNAATVLTGSCPTSDPTVVDFLGYGSTACFEGSGSAPALTIGTSNKRAVDGCGDTNSNSVDFVAMAPLPRNVSTQPKTCECTANETNLLVEMDFCNLQFPASINVQSGAATPAIFARVYEFEFTEGPGSSAAITAQIGYGPQGVDPTTQAGWTWFAATYSGQIGNDDEYMRSFTAPAPGTYGYTARFTRDGGMNWTYADLDGAGSNGGLSFSMAQLPLMTVTPAPMPVITSANTATFHVGVNGSFTVAATGTPVPTYSLAGALPSGVNFVGTTGVLSGTPALGTTGGYPLTITASNGVLPNATQNFALVVAANCTFDVDGNGAVDALTDGLLILRALFGLTGTSVTNGALGALPARATWNEIRAHLNQNCGTAFAPNP